MDKNKSILITGGTGFLGEALIKKLGGDNIRVVARNTGKLIALKEKYPIEIISGDIADPYIAQKACKGMSRVFHLAAFKYVDLAEKDTRECVKSNIIGTLNILGASKEASFVVGVSTDKAAQINGTYGATKFLMERLFREYETINPKTEYRIVRYGNVIGSTGSFITKWEDKMKRGEEVIVTDPNATRFFWTIDEAVEHIFECLKEAKDSTPYIPKMKGCSMQTALEACQEVFGKCPAKVIGLQAGENMHETLDGKTFSNQDQYTKEEFIKKFL